MSDICITFSGEKINFDGDAFVGVGSTAGGDVVIIGSHRDGEPMVKGQSYRLVGEYKDYKGQQQFAFSSYIECEPDDRRGIIAYLVRCGCRESVAKKVYKTYGPEAVAKIRLDVEDVIRSLRSNRPDELRETSVKLQSNFANEKTLIALTSLFAGRGFPKTLPYDCVEQWGEHAVKIAKRNPFALLRFDRVGYLSYAILYLSLGHNPQKLKRLAFCAWHASTEALPEAFGFDGRHIRAYFKHIFGPEFNQSKGAKAIRLACRARMIATWLSMTSHSTPTTPSTFLSYMLVAVCAQMLTEDSYWPDAYSIGDLTPHQGDALRDATKAKIGLLTGRQGPERQGSSVDWFDVS